MKRRLTDQEVELCKHWLYKTPRVKIKPSYIDMFNSIKDQFENEDTIPFHYLSDDQLRCLRTTYNSAMAQVKKQATKSHSRGNHYDFNDIADKYYNPAKPL